MTTTRHDRQQVANSARAGIFDGISPEVLARIPAARLDGRRLCIRQAIARPLPVTSRLRLLAAATAPADRRAGIIGTRTVMALLVAAGEPDFRNVARARRWWAGWESDYTGIVHRPLHGLRTRAHALRVSSRVLKPWRYVSAYESWQEYGGPEEGGWWHAAWQPVQTRRVPVWRASTVRDAMRASITSDGCGGYIFAPSPADRDPRHDYSDSDLIGARYHGDRPSVQVERVPPRPGSTFRPYC